MTAASIWIAFAVTAIAIGAGLGFIAHALLAVA